MVEASLEYKAVALVVAIILSGFFSGLEVALVGLRNSKVQQLLKEGKKGSRSLKKLKSNPGRMLASINLGNNLANVGASALATEVALDIFGSAGLAVAVGVMTFLILIFGEITPKTYCNANADKVALSSSGILLLFTYVFYPFVIFFEMITKVMLKVVGSSHKPPPITEEDIMGVVDQGMEEKAIEKHERELVKGALRIDDIIIRTVMVPRVKMFTLPADMALSQALPMISRSGFSRIPLHGESKDEIVGILHVRDILENLNRDEKEVELSSIARNPVFVSQQRKLSDLLKEMQGRQTHMAIVIDEFGGVEGCVTMEDLLEEMVGEIMDETDEAKSLFKVQDKNTIIANGEIELATINEIFKTHIKGSKAYSTLNGLLHEKLEDIPQSGDKLEIQTLRIIVEEVINHQPTKVKIEKVDKEP